MAGTLFMSPVDVVGKVVRQSGVSALGQTVMFKESDCVVDRYQLSWLCVVLVQRAFQFAGLAFFRISKAVLAECATAGVARVPTGCRCICRSVRNVSSSGAHSKVPSQSSQLAASLSQQYAPHLSQEFRQSLQNVLPQMLHRSAHLSQTMLSHLSHRWQWSQQKTPSQLEHWYRQSSQ